VYATENAAISGIDVKIDSPVTEHKHTYTKLDCDNKVAKEISLGCL